jgi:hypothetical protein
LHASIFARRLSADLTLFDASVWQSTHATPASFTWNSCENLIRRIFISSAVELRDIIAPKNVRINSNAVQTKRNPCLSILVGFVFVVGMVVSE